MGACHLGPCALLSCRSSRDARARARELAHGPEEFTVSAVKMNGDMVDIDCLRPADALATLMKKVEHALGAPPNGLLIFSGDQLFSKDSHASTLAELGISRTTQISCIFKDPYRAKLLEQLRSGDQKCEYAAMDALIELGLWEGDVHHVLEFLDRLVRGAHWWKSGETGLVEVAMYQRTVKALGKLGEDAAAAIPLVRRHARDRHVSQVSADAIGQMGKAGVKALGEMVLLSFDTPSIAAARALENLGAKAAPVKAELEEAASSADREVQHAALDALRAIQEGSQALEGT